MTKKKRSVIIIVSVVLVVAIVLSLSLGLTLGRKQEELWEPAFALGEEVWLKVPPKGGEVLKTSVTVDDLSDEYREKLFAFAQFNGDVDFWFSDNIFRNRTNNANLGPSLDKWLPLLESRKITQEYYDEICNLHRVFGHQEDFRWDWGSMASYRDDIGVKLAGLETMSKYYTKTYFNNREGLNDGEILVGKWMYYSLYARTHDFSIDLDMVEKILDSEDSIAKYAILRCADINIFGADGMAMEYYGLIKDDLDEEIEITLYSEGEEKAQTYKIVGYFEYEVSDNKLKNYPIIMDGSGNLQSLKNNKTFELEYAAWRSLEKTLYIR